MKVGILGTGKMGGAIARRLHQEGFDLRLWNRTRSRAEEIGVGTVLEGAGEVVAGSEVILSVLTGPASVHEVYDLALPSASGQVFVEMSTAGPALLDALEPKVVARGSSLVSSPIVAAPAAVERGQAFFLLGGDRAAIERIKPVIEAMGTFQVARGHRQAANMKLLSNSMLATTLAMAAELVTAGVRSGLTPDEAFAFMKRHAPYLENRKSGYLGGPYEPLTFSLKDMLKDLDLTLESLDGPDFPMPLLEAVRAAFAEVVAEHGEEEVSAVLERYR